ncbi:hypothetical protein TWF481_001917 [Arthrobotrys musiformis]|uniref:Uncharacterized protein n=1 Tax=Arthrobotrys musiformis TaxID=47236 RepID=A0AAV9VUP7_9PEZI
MPKKASGGGGHYFEASFAEGWFGKAKGNNVTIRRLPERRDGVLSYANYEDG